MALTVGGRPPPSSGGRDARPGARIPHCVRPLPVIFLVSMEPTPLQIDVHFDFLCPWCFIGKRHLAAARDRLAELLPDVRTRVAWRSHLLLPDLPLQGVPYGPFYVARLGSAEAVAARRLQVQQAARAAGLGLAFERITVMPNTAAAHDLVALAAEVASEARQADYVERVFGAYFVDGADIGDPAVLERLAVDSGLPRQQVQARLSDAPAVRKRRLRPPQQAAAAVGGVPCFVFDGTIGLSGALPPEVLLDTMLRALRRPGSRELASAQPSSSLAPR